MKSDKTSTKLRESAGWFWTLLVIAAFAFVLVGCQASMGTRSADGTGGTEEIYQRLYAAAQPQIEQAKQEAVTAAIEEVERRIEKFATERGVDYNQLKQELIAETRKDVDSKLSTLPEQPTAQDFAKLALEVVDQRMRELPENPTKEDFKQMARSSVGEIVGPSTWFGIGRIAASALGLGGPIGLAIGMGLFGVSRVLRRRRDPQQTVVTTQLPPMPPPVSAPPPVAAIKPAEPAGTPPATPG